MGLGGGLLLFTVLAGALLGSALLGHAGQVSTETSFGGISNEERDGLKETPQQDVSTTEGAFESRLPEQAQPEEGALGYLRLLEHLPAQPPAIGGVSSPFGIRIAPHRGYSYAAQGYQAGSRFGREEFHSGIDIAVPPGTPVRAPGPGVVLATGRSPRLGTYVRLLHEEVQLETVLAHLSRVAGRLKRGQPVRRGEVVGFSGNSGRSTGPHLHFEIRSLPGRVPVDPTEVYALYFTCLDRLSRFPIGSVHARLVPYRIWAPVGEGRGKSE
jgi:murein DD-endopeptidase MepM/ murein hydrolase activator NlpD